ncbi:MAG TPA: glycosyltransferase [Candidatus Acidoferrales bacterium]|nr:glycosyltransferase [Candidatus Acidoferrales bacterium]
MSNALLVRNDGQILFARFGVRLANTVSGGAVIPPQFSVIITCHDQAVFIQDAVNSAFAQDYKAREVIVVDDASSDGSVDILKAFGNSLRLISAPKNIGANAARNLGASIAGGDYLVFLDGDDLLLPWALRTYKAVISATQAPILLGRLLFFEGAQRPESEEIPTEITFVEYENLIEKDRTYRASASATVVKRTTFHQVGGWTEGLFHLDDLDIMMKLGVSGRCVQILSPASTCYRVHEGNTVRQVSSFVPAMLTLIKKEKAGEYPGGARFRYKRYAFLGGPISFWIKRCLRARLYANANSLVIKGWVMAFAAAMRRFSVKLSSGVPPRTLPMSGSD